MMPSLVLVMPTYLPFLLATALLSTPLQAFSNSNSWSRTSSSPSFQQQQRSINGEVIGKAIPSAFLLQDRVRIHRYERTYVLLSKGNLRETLTYFDFFVLLNDADTPLLAFTMVRRQRVVAITMMMMTTLSHPAITTQRPSVVSLLPTMTLSLPSFLRFCLATTRLLLGFHPFATARIPLRLRLTPSYRG